MPQTPCRCRTARAAARAAGALAPEADSSQGLPFRRRLQSFSCFCHAADSSACLARPRLPPRAVLFLPHPPKRNSGTNKETRGTAYVVYEDIYDAKTACEHLSGFNVSNRYLIVLYYNPIKQKQKLGLKEQEEALRKLQEAHGVDGEQHAPRPQSGGGGGKA